MKKKFEVLIIFILLTMSLPGLFNREVWFDEKASLTVSNKQLPQLLETTARDTHPPLYFLLLKGWSGISSHYLFLRSLSLIFAVSSILTLWQLTQKFLDTFTSRIATLLLAVSPLHVYFATEIRMYSLFLFETLLLTLIFLKFLKQHDFKNFMQILVLELIILYTQYYAILIIISLTFWLWLKKRRILKRWLLIQFVAGLFFLPWILYSTQFSKPACWCFSPLIGVPTLFSAFAVGGMGIVTHKDLFMNGSISIILLFLTTACLLFSLFVKGVNNRSASASLIVNIFFLPLLIMTPIGFLTLSFSPRAFIFLLPFYLIFVSIGIATLKSFSKLVLTSMVTLLATISLIQGINPFFTKIPEYKKDLDLQKLEFFRP